MTRIGKTTVSSVSPVATLLRKYRLCFQQFLIISGSNSKKIPTALTPFKVHQGRWNFKSFGGDKPIWWALRIDYFPWPWSIHSQSYPIFIERSDKYQQILCDVISERMNNDCWVSNSSLLKVQSYLSKVV